MNNTLIQAVINTIEKPKSQEWKDKRNELIKNYAKAASVYCLKPWDIADKENLFEKYKIKEEDFVEIVYESPYGAMVMGVSDWKPRFEFSDEEYKNQMKREEIKLFIWKSINNISDDNLKKHITKLIEDNYFESWEQLDGVVGITKFYETIKKFSDKTKCIHSKNNICELNVKAMCCQCSKYE